MSLISALSSNNDPMFLLSNAGALSFTPVGDESCSEVSSSSSLTQVGPQSPPTLVGFGIGMSPVRSLTSPDIAVDDLDMFEFDELSASTASLNPACTTTTTMYRSTSTFSDTSSLSGR